MMIEIVVLSHIAIQYQSTIKQGYIMFKFAIILCTMVTCQFAGADQAPVFQKEAGCNCGNVEIKKSKIHKNKKSKTSKPKVG